jgi:hypothetical protein
MDPDGHREARILCDDFSAYERHDGAVQQDGEYTLVVNRQGANNPQGEMETAVDVTEEHPGTTKVVEGFTATEHIFRAAITTRAIWVLDTVPRPTRPYSISSGWRAKRRQSDEPGGEGCHASGYPQYARSAEWHARTAPGLHVTEVTRMSMSMDMGSGAAAGAQTAPPVSPQPDTTQPDSTQTNTSNPAPATTQAATSKLGGLCGALARGALGGFGSRKAATPAPAAAHATPPQTTTAPTQPAPANGDMGILSETATELGNFSMQPVGTAQFDVPAGYKQVESPIEKMLNSIR